MHSKLPTEALQNSYGGQPPHFNTAIKCLELDIVNVSHLLTVNFREDLVYLLGNVLHSK